MAYKSKSYRKFVATAATATLVASAVTPAFAAEFTDVNKNYKDAVNYLVENDIAKGKTDSTFGTDQSITRGDAAVMIANVLKLDVTKAPASPFKDLNDRVKGAVNALYAAEIINGKTATEFKPDANITRAEMAKIITNAYKLEAGDTKNVFEDVNNNWDKYVDALLANEITKGKTATTFAPDQNVTRGEFALFMYRGKDHLPAPGVKVSEVTATTVANTTSAIVTAKVTNAEKDAEGKVEIFANGEDKVTATKTVKVTDGQIKAEFSDLPVGTHTAKVTFGDSSATASFTVVAVDPKLESIEAINAKQLQVTFATPMDKKSVTDFTKYAIKKAGQTAVDLSSVTVEKAELSTDGKIVTITLKGSFKSAFGIVEGDVFNVHYKDLKAANGKEIKKGSVTVKFSDKVAPEFISATASAKKSTNKVTVAFNEPVDVSQATATIDGKSVKIDNGSKPNEIVLTSSTNLEVGKEYNVNLLNIKDFAGNLMTTNPVKTTVTVASDTVAPTVTDIKVVRDSLLEVTFDKSMDVKTVTQGSVRVLDVNLNNTDITQGAVTAKPDTDNKTFLVPVTALPFNNGTFSGVVSVANTVKDEAGNALDAVTKNITIAKDTAAPTVVSSTYKNVTKYGDNETPNGAIVIKFNEAVKEVDDASYVVVNNKTGGELDGAIRTPFVNTNNDTELVLPLANKVEADSTTYSVIVPKNAVTDKAIAKNASEAANLTVDVSAGAPVASDTTAPKIEEVKETAATNSTSGTKITVTFTEEGSGLDSATVTNTNNYRLDGVALPSGTYITLDNDTKTATINIPAGSFAKDKDYAFNINGVKDKAGNAISPYVGKVTLNDDIAPELTAATINNNGTVTLTFSESVGSATGTEDTEADFEVKLNDEILNASAYTLADGVGSDAGKYVLTVVTKASNVSDGDGIDGTAKNYLYIDVNGNDSFDSGKDIVIESKVAETGTADDYAVGTYNLNNATSLKVGTVKDTTKVKDTSENTNVIKGSKTITVK